MVPAITIVAYFAIGIIAFWPVTPGAISHHLLGVDADFGQSVWFMAWVPHALLHGENPFFSHAIFTPNGVNLLENTSSPFLGLLTVPLSGLVTPLEQANVLLVLCMPVSATAAFVVLRRWSVWGPAAAIGGLLYGFSPFMTGQALGHIELLFVPIPPLIALTITSILQHRGSPNVLGALLGFLVAAQFLVSAEVLASMLVLLAVALVCVAIRFRSRLGELIPPLVRPVSISIGVTVVLLAYPIWMMLAGPQHFGGHTWAIVNPWHNDILSFVVPGPLQKTTLGLGAIGARLAAPVGLTEAGGYIGIPLLLIGGLLAYRSRRSSRMQLVVTLFIVAVILSLGPHLAIDGRTTSIPLPFLVLDHLPLLDNLLPIRITFEVEALFAVIIAFGLDDIHHAVAPDRSARRRTRRGAAIVAAVTAVVVVVTLLPRWPPEPAFAAPPAVLLPAALSKAIPTGDPVTITYPFYINNPQFERFGTQPMLWQAQDGFDFRLLAGFAYRPTAEGLPTLQPPAIRPVELPTFLLNRQGLTAVYGPLTTPPMALTPAVVEATRTTLDRYGVRLVLVDRSAPGSSAVVTLFTDALGRTGTSVGRFDLWSSPPLAR